MSGGRPRARRRMAVGAAAAAAAATLASLTVAPAAIATATPGTSPASAGIGLGGHYIGHVFVIVLENMGYARTFGSPSADPYLATTLPSKGALLKNYYGIGHESNDNYLAMVSGQGPNPQTQADCQGYDSLVGSGPTVSPGQAVGSGCVFPQSVQTIGNQLSETAHSWKGYMDDMGNVPSRESVVCAHPALNSQDNTQSAVKGDGYVTRHDPFVYFHSVIDAPKYCAAHVVPLGTADGSMPAGTPTGTTGLARDLRSTSTTPNLSFIVPDVCEDGHDYPCVNEPSGTSALADITHFLKIWVPKITGSPAFQKNGLLIITFDEASTSDATACCGEGPGPNSPLPGITGLGGGRVGAVLLSPFIKGGTVSSVPYNHYSLLASLEKNFGVSRLGYAATASATFGKDVFG